MKQNVTMYSEAYFSVSILFDALGIVMLQNALFWETWKPSICVCVCSGPCPSGFLQCDNGNCYKSEQTCDFTDNCGDGTDEMDCGTSCSFEHGRCGWKSSLADTFSWTLGVGSIHRIRPSHDHTLKNESGKTPLSSALSL